jgi:hypothetical protein
MNSLELLYLIEQAREYAYDQFTEEEQQKILDYKEGDNANLINKWFKIYKNKLNELKQKGEN